MCCSPRGLRELDTTERLNNNSNDNTPGRSQKIRVFREGGAAAGDESQVYVLDPDDSFCVWLLVSPPYSDTFHHKIKLLRILVKGILKENGIIELAARRQ